MSKYFLIAAMTFLLSLFACRSADKLTQICNDNVTECNQSCTSSNARFTQTKNLDQRLSRCDQNCDSNYRACLKRQQDKSVPGINGY